MKQNKTAWFFGDSFTANTHSYVWTNLFTEYFNAEQQNFGVGGNSNQEILTTAYRYMDKIMPGDFVVVGKTISTRTIGVNFFKDNIGTYNNEILTYENWHELLKDVEGCHYVPIKKEQANILINYIYEFIEKKIDVWDRYWEQQFLILKRNLELLNINVILWSNNLWDQFESITEETNGKVFDPHWSKRGNEDFFKHLVYNLNKGNNILGLESIHILET